MARRQAIVVLGLLSRLPYAGVIWQTMHYLQGLERLGFDVYYADVHGSMPLRFFRHDHDDGWARAASWLGGTMERFGFAGRWAYHPASASGRTFGLSRSDLGRLYGSAALVLNLHGGTEPSPELSVSGPLVYLETDPVQLQVELQANRRYTVEFLSAHHAFFTFAENLGHADCGLPADPRFEFKATRQPVVLDWWPPGSREAATYTTVGNYRQTHRNIEFAGETYYWSKHREFARVRRLPRLRPRASFELALAKATANDQDGLARDGWSIRDAVALSDDADVYRTYIVGSRAEFTVAKDQNVRLRTGWFSDRSATYLAAGRPVITQDTGFGCALPTGEGLLAFSDLDTAVAAVDRVESDYLRHRRAAHDVAREYFSHEAVLKPLLAEVGL